MGLIVRFHRKSVPPVAIDPQLGPDLAADEWAAMRILAGILRLASALNRTKRRRVRDVVIRRRGDRLQVSVITFSKSSSALDLHKAHKEIEALEKSWGIRISLDS